MPMAYVIYINQGYLMYENMNENNLLTFLLLLTQSIQFKFPLYISQ